MPVDPQPSLFDDLELECDDVISETDFATNYDDASSSDHEEQPTVEIIRSKNRKRSVSAKRVGNKTLVYVPARMSKADVDLYVAELVAKLDRREEISASQEHLVERAKHISLTYLEVNVFETHRVPVTVRWVTNQNSRWGSCTPSEGTIRLSHRLQTMPQYVIDCVLLHELAHLLVADHGPRFKALIGRHPEYVRASAFLDGFSHASSH